MKQQLPLLLLAFAITGFPTLLADDPSPEDTFRGPPRSFSLVVRQFAGPDTVGNPISLAIDEQGRVFVAETHRYTVGVKETRGKRELEELELQVRTVEEFKKGLVEHLKRGAYRRDEDPTNVDPDFIFHTDLSEEIAVYADLNNDGKSDERAIFATGFNDWYSGPGADVFVEDGSVYFMCIPDLWILKDTDNDGEASGDERQLAATGFGVIFSFLGHDLHGMVRGNDGRLYFSVGDRSFNVTTAEGNNFEGKMGAVFRMNDDGSDLELFATGLRNPQDLAFDNYGNLVTGDNNCDKGDLARIVLVVEGSDHGWRLPVQRVRNGGPWLHEKMWWTVEGVAEKLGYGDPVLAHRDPSQPAWLLPPLAHPDGGGPSGICHYPGLGLPARYDDHFFLTHCAGGGGFIQSFKLVPDGASARVQDFHIFVEQDVITGPSDAAFGFDGRMYTTNWGSGWNPNDDASLYTVWDEDSISDPRIEEVSALMKEGFEGRTESELSDLLGHTDQRVRQKAQRTLARRGDEGLSTLILVAHDATRPELARMHGLWGIAQNIRERHLPPSAIISRSKMWGSLTALLEDDNPRVREITALAIGDMGTTPPVESAISLLVGMLEDDDARVQFQAALALGKLRAEEAREPLIELLVRNNDQDLYLRHSAVMALSGIGDAAFLEQQRDNPSRAARLGAVLALRRLAAPETVSFLGDTDLQVSVEAARAIYDLRIEEAFEALATTLENETPDPELATGKADAGLRRAIAINLRLPEKKSARRLLEFAALPAYPEDVRLFALECFDSFDQDTPKDPVWYAWWPGETMDESELQEVFMDAQRDGLLDKIQSQSDLLRRSIRKLRDRLLPPRPPEELLAEVADEAENENIRIDSLHQASSRESAAALPTIEAALSSKSERLRAEARRVLCSLDPLAGLSSLEEALRTGTSLEKQLAINTLPLLTLPRTRYVRVDLPGERRLLCLAEVQLFSGDRNVALEGTATQSSTDWEGPAKLAIDGNTDGDHTEKAAVSHTAKEVDPWWELDLGREFPAESLNVWNRTDKNNSMHLDGAVVSLLNSNRDVLHQTVLETAPPVNMQIDFGPGGLASLWAERILTDFTGALAGDRLDPKLAAVVLERARENGSPGVRKHLLNFETKSTGPLGSHSAALEGGDVERGETLFRFDPVAQCLRCHQIDGVGGTVGPDLSGVGAVRSRSQLLKAMVDPTAEVTRGYGDVSSMPGIGETHSPTEIRDLVAYLTTLKNPDAPLEKGGAPDSDASPPPPRMDTPLIVFWVAAGWLGLTLLLIVAPGLRRRHT